ncbi:MAG: thioredoxin [Clostridia bacterium]|nr:thioredoxin [Clostridia bacterium]
MKEPIIVGMDNFESDVLNSEKTVLLDFWAEWCGPCRLLSPTVDEIASERDDIVVGKVNVDNEEQLAAMFGVQSIPTLAVVKKGEVAEMSVGVKSKEAILAMLD